MVHLVDNRCGRVIEFDDEPGARTLYRFRRVCAALERVRAERGDTVYFLTLTLRDADVDTLNDSVSRFCTFLRERFRRAGVRWAYVWVAELQKKRYRRSGVLALHWHFAIVCPPGCLPDVEYNGRYRLRSDGRVVSNADLVARWGRGLVLCQVARSDLYWYLRKYMEKDYESLAGYRPEWAGLRRFGSSRLGVEVWPEWAREWAAEAIEGVDDPVYPLRRGAVAILRVRDAEGGFREVARARSPWRVSHTAEGLETAPSAGATLGWPANGAGLSAPGGAVE